MAITAEELKKTYSGYQSWNDPASIVADYLATGGSGKGNTPYILGQNAATAPAGAAPAGLQPTTDINELIKRLQVPSTAYGEAETATKAQIPLIQQRYQTLLNELQAGETKAAEAGIGEARARSSAVGTFYGTTELGTEAVLRKQAEEAIRGGREKYGAAQAEEIGGVTTALANLGITKAEAEKSGISDALNALLKLKDISTGGAGGTATEREKATARTAMLSDIKRGVTLEEISKKYGGKLDPYEIINAYDTSNIYGARTESIDQILSWIAEGGTTAGQTIKEDDQDRANYYNLLDNEEYKTGTMSDEDIRGSLERAGSDSKLSYFKPLFTNNPYNKTKQTTGVSGQRVSSLKKTTGTALFSLLGGLGTLGQTKSPWASPTLGGGLGSIGSAEAFAKKYR